MKSVLNLATKQTTLILTCVCLSFGSLVASADEGELDISESDKAKDQPTSAVEAAKPAEPIDGAKQTLEENPDTTQAIPKAKPASESDDKSGGQETASESESATENNTTSSSSSETVSESGADESAIASSESGETVEAEPAPPEPFVMLDSEVPPGATRRLSWIASESFSGISVPTPVLVAHGANAGPTLCLTAAIHGDELNGIEMVRRVLYGLKPEKLSGTVIGVPIVNLFGFRRNSRYLPDRRDLNRYFPGDPKGSSASRIAHAFFESVIKKCDYLVDLHTGSFHRTNLPQLRADLSNPGILKITQGFGATAVLRNKGQVGTLRRAASDAGVPAVTLEAGEPTRFQPEEVAHGVKGIQTLLNKLGMVKRVSLWGDPQPIYYASDWVRADTGGILFSRVKLGDEVEKDQVLGTVTDPITNNRSEIVAPQRGRILGMALNQVVIPGFASFRIGIEKSSDEVVKEAIAQPKDESVKDADTAVAEKDKSSAEAGSKPDDQEGASAASPSDEDDASGTESVPKASKDGVDQERPD